MEGNESNSSMYGQSPSPHARRHGVVLLAATAVLIPAAAHANAGTPLMWLTACHLFIGNFAIAAIEAGITHWIDDKRGFWWRFLFFLIANYLTMSAGAAVLVQGTSLSELWLDGEMSNGMFRGALILLVASTFPLTILLEAPFCALMIRKGSRSMWRALKISLIANSVSYALLFFLYSTSTIHGMLFKVDVGPVDLPPNHPIPWIYFGSADDQLIRLKLDGTGRESIGYVDLSWRDRTFPLPPAEGDGYDLAAADWSSTPTIVYRHFADLVGGSRMLTSSGDPRGSEYRSFFDLRPNGMTDDSAIRVTAGFWPNERGLIVRRNGRETDLRLDTPLAQYTIESVNVLPSEHVVFALMGWDKNRIMLLDPQTLRMQVLAEGRAPVAGYYWEDWGDGVP